LHLAKLGFGIEGWRLKFRDIDMRDSKTVEEIRDMRLRNGSWTLDRYRADIGEPPVDGGDQAVLVDRQNLVSGLTWAASKAADRHRSQGHRAGARRSGARRTGHGRSRTSPGSAAVGGARREAAGAPRCPASEPDDPLPQEIGPGRCTGDGYARHWPHFREVSMSEPPDPSPSSNRPTRRTIHCGPRMSRRSSRSASDEQGVIVTSPGLLRRLHDRPLPALDVAEGLAVAGGLPQRNARHRRLPR
jgi:hypothetical protein